MNRQEHLLICCMEECDEVSHRISKALRFGIQQIQKARDDKPEQNPEQLSNADRIWREYSDLVAVMEMAGFNTKLMNHSRIVAKKEKVEKYLRLAKAEGTLNE